MDLKKTFGTDKNLEQEGAWIDLGDGARIKVARLTNKAFRDFVERRKRNQRHALESGGDAAEAIANAILIEGMARFILLGWETVAIDGVNQEYCTANADKILNEFPDFKNQILAIAADRANFRAEEVAEAGKN